LFSDASGIPVQNISLRVYEEAFYIGKATEEGMNFSLILEILLAALIVGLLLFVVFRAMKPAEVVETEPELSVERLLATTRENQSLEDIEFGEKSETRKMIEKYIDENADAVAALLRNWLNDDGWN
ncbi:MAG: flagellar M-ring protein FliF, partial [Lachnospiraceae bacterium]|nr:flagellar M-ring protein FliF [Lachnospiraceae bacterium]